MSGRIRTLKPEWLEDEKVAALSDAARLLSVGLVLIADDHGLGRAHPLFIASRAWPYGVPHETLTKVSCALQELADAGFIQLYSVGGQRYYAIRNWQKHQKVQHVGKPRVPTPEEAEPESTQETLTRVSGDSHETLTPYLRPHISDHDHRPSITSESRENATSDAPAVRRVFDRWLELHWSGKGPRPKLDAKRRARIRGRLAEHDEATLCAALQGALADAWCMGRDPKSPRAYRGLETLLRDAAQVERLAALASQAAPQSPHDIELARLRKLETEAAFSNPVEYSRIRALIEELEGSHAAAE